jgi:hypothetical protein
MFYFCTAKFSVIFKLDFENRIKEHAIVSLKKIEFGREVSGKTQKNSDGRVIRYLW